MLYLKREQVDKLSKLLATTTYCSKHIQHKGF